jgi:hypothetical protein
MLGGALLIALALGTLFAATPIQITTASGSIGVAASQSQLLFTQPFCSDASGLLPVARGVYSVNTTTGIPSLYAALPIPSVPAVPIGGVNYYCAEPYLALAATGNHGGFTPGAAYVTQGANIYVVPPGGGSATLLTITGTPLTATEGHSGISFDTEGAFGYHLIFASSDGVWTVTAAGFATKIASGVSPGSDVYMESPSVSPFGVLYGTVEDDTLPAGVGPLSGLYYLAGGAGGVLTLVAGGGTHGTQSPESINFVPTNSCSLAISGVSYGGFLSVFSAGSAGSDLPTDSFIDGFSTAAISPYAGKAIETFEYSSSSGYATGPDMEVYDPSAASFTPFANVLTQLEGFNLVTCNVPPPPPSVCPLTLGYWKNHQSAWPKSVVFPYTIGGVSYTAANFETILSTPPKGGNAVQILGMQLIAAILNVANGAPATPLIAQANTLLAANNINLLTSTVHASTVLGQQLVSLGSTLNDYNSSCGI